MSCLLYLYKTESPYRTNCYANDDTRDAFYTGWANISHDQTYNLHRNKLVSEVGIKISDCSRNGAITAKRKQFIVFSLKTLPLLPQPWSKILASTHRGTFSFAAIWKVSLVDFEKDRCIQQINISSRLAFSPTGRKYGQKLRAVFIFWGWVVPIPAPSIWLHPIVPCQVLELVMDM